MAFFDVRAPISFHWVNILLLEAAEHPSSFADLIYAQSEVAYGTDPRSNPTNLARFVALSRQSCAAIVINCSSQLWSVLVGALLVLEPSNQMTEDVKDFVENERLGTLKFYEHFFKICGQPFGGTKIQEDLKLIYDLRNLLVHDHPDKLNADIEKQSNRLIARLRSRLSESELTWLPEIPTLYASGRPVPATDSNVAIMNFMRFPLANWVIQTTEEIATELFKMISAFPGQKLVVQSSFTHAVPQSMVSASLLEKLRVGGISKQFTI